MFKLVCKIILPYLIISTLNGHASTYETISASKSDSIISAHFDDTLFYIIDVRTPSEYDGGHLKNSYNIDYRDSDFSNNLDSLPKNGTYLIHCQSGGRSAGALSVFESKEFETVYEIENGYKYWPYETTTETTKQYFTRIDAIQAFDIIENSSPALVNITDQESFDLFNIETSILRESNATATPCKSEIEIETPIILYSSSEENLDSCFYSFFQSNYAEVYYFENAKEDWIAQGYAYNSIDTVDNTPVDTISTNVLPTEPTFQIISTGSYEITLATESANKVSVFNLNGQALYHSSDDQNIHQISVNHKGIYILKIDSTPFSIYIE